MILTGKRINWIDWAKGWTIFWVVVFHAFKSVHDTYIFGAEYQFMGEGVIFVIATFIMPVFFALSGFVYKEIHSLSAYRQKIIKRIISLFIPYVAFSLAYVTMQHVSPGSSNHEIYSWSSLLWIFYNPISYLWYIHTLVLIYLLSGIFDLFHISIEKQFIISLVLFLIANSFKLPYFLELLFLWLVTFDFGRILRTNAKFYNQRSGIYAGILICIAWAIQIRLSGEFWYDTNGINLENFISKMSSIPLFFSLYSNLNANRLNKYFEKCGRDSLIIYLVHAPTVSVMRSLFIKLFGCMNYWLIILGIICMSWMISIMVCRLAKKVNFVEFVFYPTKYIHIS